VLFGPADPGEGRIEAEGGICGREILGDFTCHNMGGKYERERKVEQGGQARGEHDSKRKFFILVRAW